MFIRKLISISFQLRSIQKRAKCYQMEGSQLPTYFRTCAPFRIEGEIFVMETRSHYQRKMYTCVKNKPWLMDLMKWVLNLELAKK